MKASTRVTAALLAIPVAGALAGLGIASTGGTATVKQAPAKSAKAARIAKQRPAARSIVHQRCHADPDA